MRVYLPATLTMLAAASANGAYRLPEGLTAHAVTPALREWFTEGDADELEYAALLDAALSSVRALARDPGAPRARVVLAAEVPDGAVAPSGVSPSAVTLSAAVPLEQVVSVHVDDDDAAGAVAAAVTALPDAEAGDDDAQFAVDGADGHDLLWYDVTEIPALLRASG